MPIRAKFSKHQPPHLFIRLQTSHFGRVICRWRAASARTETKNIPMTSAGIIDLACKHPVAETVARLETFLTAKGLRIFARIDQAAEAAAAGLTMRPMVLLIFGDPKAGTPLMLRYPSLALDLPLKALVWESPDGKTWLSYNSPEFLQQRHGLEKKPFEPITQLLQTAAQPNQ